MKNLMKIMFIGLVMASLLVAGCQQQQAPDQDNETMDDEPEPEPEPQVQTVEVTLDEWGISPATITADAGTVEFQVTNEGNIYHEFEIEGQGMEEVIEGGVGAGQTETLTVDLSAGSYEVYCPIPGNPSHRERGMEATLTVE